MTSYAPVVRAIGSDDAPTTVATGGVALRPVARARSLSTGAYGAAGTSYAPVGIPDAVRDYALTVLLAFDTATPRVTVAVADGATVLAERRSEWRIACSRCRSRAHADHVDARPTLDGRTEIHLS